MNTIVILKLLNKWPTYNSIASSMLVYFSILSIQYLLEFGGYGTVILVISLGLPMVAVFVAIAVYALFSLVQSFYYSEESNSKIPAIFSIGAFMLALFLPKFDYNYEEKIIRKKIVELNSIVAFARDKKIEKNPDNYSMKASLLLPKSSRTFSKYDCFVQYEPTLMVKIAPRNPYWVMTFIEDSLKWVRQSDEIDRKRILERWYLVKYDFN